MAEPIRYHFEVGGHRGGGKAWICAGRDDKICLSVLVLPLVRFLHSQVCFMLAG